MSFPPPFWCVELLRLLRYAYRSTEKVALQEIGPRFTLKLRWIKKNIPAVLNYGEEPKGLEFDVEPMETEQVGNDDTAASTSTASSTPTTPTTETAPSKITPPKQDGYLWLWKVCLIHFVILTTDHRTA